MNTDSPRPLIKEVDPGIYELSSMVFCIMNFILLLIYVIPALLVLKKFKFKLDRSALINITIYAVSFLTRAIMWGLAWIDHKGDKSTFRGIMIVLEYVAAFII
jgi:hypothetical protein